MRIFQAAIILTMGLALSGCSTTEEFQRRFEDRWGPSPMVSSDDVAVVMKRQHETMSQFVSYWNKDFTKEQQASQPVDWFAVSKFGMNYVDEKCDLYMGDLFKLSREHDRNNSIFNVARGATEAFLNGAYSAAKAKIPLLVIGQSFGLLTSFNDAISKTYLFEQKVPGIVADKVKEARIAYRNQLDHSSIQDEATAYQAVRDYLDLCMPQTIEGKFLELYVKHDPQAVPTAKAKTKSKRKQTADLTSEVLLFKKPATSSGVNSFRIK